MKKCVFVIGPESSGSKLIARICSHALGIRNFDEWNGTAWSNKGNHKVCHRSLPYDIPPKFPDIRLWIAQNEKDYEIFFILTTRDITISEVSRFQRWAKPYGQSAEESAKAREIMTYVMMCNKKWFVWSYETFIFLQKAYLDSLYRFLDIQSDFIPEITDGNMSKVIKPNDNA